MRVKAVQGLWQGERWDTEQGTRFRLAEGQIRKVWLNSLEFILRAIAF